jgi:hypothetical protein
MHGFLKHRSAILILPVALVMSLALVGCQDSLTDPMAETNATAAGEGLATNVTQSSSSNCLPTGTGLTAKVVNEDVIGETIDVGNCDVGAFFSENGQVEDASFTQNASDPASGVQRQYAVLVDGANVNVTESNVDVTDDYVHQFIGIGYRNGASGTIAENAVTGFHRVGILLDGSGTSAVVRSNDVTGIGEKTTGWAENGIQVSGGATGTVNDNEISNHWWDLNSFVSSGIIVFESDEVTVQHNTFAGNDASLVLLGSRNNAVGNEVAATAPDGNKDGTLHYGALVYGGENNGLRQNEFSTSTSADVGIYVVGGSVNTKLIRNTFSGGFGTKIFDGGGETKLPQPFDPSS